MSVKKKYRTSGGVVVTLGTRMLVTTRRGLRDWKVCAYRETGGFHGLLWLKSLCPVRARSKRGGGK